ncbi:MAG TPA: hypothetical protein PLC61_02325 [Chitinophagales bacterium]|nr:hypothetical protein [Chitinophagales bacterium]MCB9074901.1 hypothetical protein [Chitinophagales bacterium]HMU98164.1 hypothetical protein [Chitinophagales bacterium]HMW94735.1 hypothetical protein [Chitinophagales bacterium]HMZ93476.1 hypothetical protein [Chitinophagales bacterium]
MKKYIIVTPEGQTVAPNADYEVDNLQVLGIVENVRSKDEAIIKLLKENDWIIDAEFNVTEFIIYELL